MPALIEHKKLSDLQTFVFIILGFVIINKCLHYFHYKHCNIYPDGLVSCNSYTKYHGIQTLQSLCTNIFDNFQSCMHKFAVYNLSYASFCKLTCFSYCINRKLLNTNKDMIIIIRFYQDYCSFVSK